MIANNFLRNSIALYSSWWIHHSEHSIVPTSSMPASQELTMPQGFFVAWFLGTCLGDTASRMTYTKVAPEVLKPQECNSNTGRSKPLTPYIPKKDVFQEAVDSSANMLKLLLTHKVELHVPVWLKETPKQFMYTSNRLSMTSDRKALRPPFGRQWSTMMSVAESCRKPVRP